MEVNFHKQTITNNRYCFLFFRQILENKAKLYNSLARRGSQLSERELEISKRTLVQFDKKQYPIENKISDEEYDSDEYEPARNSDDEWVEYTDVLGRTRKCLRKDLEYMKRKDEDLSKCVESLGQRIRNEPQKYIKESKENTDKITNENDVKELSEENELLSSDMRRELLRREWEKQEQELLNKKNIHYQDILFNGKF